MARHNKKLLVRKTVSQTISAAILFGSTLFCASAIAAPCRAPADEIILGSDRPESAHAIAATQDDKLLIVGSRALDDKTSQGFAIKLDPCGHIDWRLSLTPTGGSGLASALALRDGGYLLGGTAHRLDNPETNDAILVRLDKNGRHLWTKPFQGDQNYAITNLVDLGATFLAVLQPHLRETKENTQKPLKPDEERPVFLEVDLAGTVIEQFSPLTEEKSKVFHIGYTRASDKLLVSGRYSYFGQPTRAAFWTVDRTTAQSTRIFTGKTIGLSFGTFDDGPSNQTTIVWRSRLASNAPTVPLGIVQLRDGRPSEVWSAPADAIATLPAASLRTEKGDIIMVLQSFPRQDQDVTITITRVSPDGSEVFSKALTKPFDTVATSIVERPNQALVIAGRTNQGDSENGDAWILSMDADGTQQNARKTIRW